MAKETEIKAFNTIFYHFNNYKCVEYNGKYVPEVLVKADFPCGNEHIVGKWVGNCDYNNGNGTLALWRLYGELDGECRRAMLGWIFDNYTCNIGL